MVEIKARIDRASHTPYYLQLKTQLQERIERGEWRPGDLIPSEAELGQSFEVSRTVVRQALQDLTYQGLVVRRKGKGTFVAQPKIASRGLVQSLEGFYQDLAERGVPVVNQVLEQALVPADSEVASNLGLEPLVPVVKLVRLRLVEGEPIVLVTSYLPYERCRSLIQANLQKRSLYAFLDEECGLKIGRGSRSIEAVLAGEAEAKLLKLKVGAPLMRLRSVSYTSDGAALEFFDALFRGDRSRFEVEIMAIAGHGERRARRTRRTR